MISSAYTWFAGTVASRAGALVHAVAPLDGDEITIGSAAGVHFRHPDFGFATHAIFSAGVLRLPAGSRHRCPHPNGMQALERAAEQEPVFVPPPVRNAIIFQEGLYMFFGLYETHAEAQEHIDRSRRNNAAFGLDEL